MTKAFRQAEHAFANGVDPRAWKIFTQDTKEELQHFQQEVLEELARDTKENRE